MAHTLTGIKESISLYPYNSFRVQAVARYFAAFRSRDELELILDAFPEDPALLLGGGSNILLTRNIDGLVLKNEISGITELHEDNDYVYVRAGAGENWHRFVQYCIDRNWAGLENLSLIPGSVGASPLQNIGAYGVELEDVFWDLQAWHIREKRQVTFTRNDCGFGYRDSVFKKKYRGEFVILDVTFQLRKKPRFHVEYGAIRQELERMGVTELSLRAVSDAVIRIRSSKLPDPASLGNAGSFFKNPEVGASQFHDLQKEFPDIVGYPLPGGSVKLAAGWLIEQCGPGPGLSWKGYRVGEAGCHALQALVLVNYGEATGREILAMADAIADSVKVKFSVELEKEVHVI